MSENIKKIYKSAVKRDDQQQYKAIIEEAMVFTPEGFTCNSPIPPNQYIIVKNTTARKSLHQFLDTLEVKLNTDVLRLCADKSKRKSIRYGSMLWSSVTHQLIHAKINQQVTKNSLQLKSTASSVCFFYNIK